MSDVRWEGYSHAEIYALVHAGPGAAVSSAAMSLWKDAQKLIKDTDQRVADAVKQVAGGWEGSAADATRAAMSPLQGWALDATGDATLTASAVDAQGAQAMNVRNTMPEPQTGRTWGVYDSGDVPWLVTDVAAAEERDANNHARAVELMNGYMNTSFENRGRMDYWTLPPSITIETASASPGAPGHGVAPTASGAAPVPAGGEWSPPAAAPNAPAPNGAMPGSAVPGTVTPSTAAPGPVAPGVVPGVTAPSAPPGGARPAPGTIAPGAIPAPTAPGATGARPTGAPPPGAVPGAADGRGSRTPPGRTPPGPSGVQPVVPAPPRNTPGPGWRDVVPGGGREPAAAGERPAPRPEAARQPTARPGAALQPGLYPPMIAGGAGGEGREHRRPDYLVEDADVFADDRWFTPPVIGGDE